ncbi:unnamed protein product [Somion occarium]|uniref:Piwi domain-containing protein n=1 Tax=Somion occarium TaxID=3059160 RepID=A0ABP1D958_9APHY
MQSQPRPSGRTRMRVITNSFAVTRVPTVVLFQYDVVISPTLKPDNPRRRSEIIDKMQLTNANIFPRRGMYDGKNIFYTIGYKVENMTIPVQLNKSDKTPYIVRLTNTTYIDSNTLNDMVSSNGRAYRQGGDQNQAAINALQLIVRQAANMRHGFPLQAKSFFTKDGAKELGGGLQAWRGYFQSVRPVLGRLLVNVDVTHSAVVKAGPLLDVAMEFCNFRDIRDLAALPTDPNPQRWLKLQRFLKGVLIKPGSQFAKWSKGRPIRALIPNAGGYEFHVNGQPTTVRQYFQQKYNFALRYSTVFGIQIGKDAVFPAEVCTITPGQLYKKKLSEDQTKSFVSLAVQKPHQRLGSIESAVSGDRQLLDYQQSDFLATAGMVISTRPLEVEGHVLTPPQVLFGGRQASPINNGAWNVMGRQFLTPKKIDKLMVLVCVDPSERQAVEYFTKALVGNLTKLGSYAGGAPYFHIANLQNMRKTLEEVHKMQPGFVLVILPASAAIPRRYIKFWSSVISGIPTQCVRKGKYDSGKGLDQYCNNVALKMHAKYGGINSVVYAPIMDKLMGTMIIGCDVSHPAPGVNNRPSFASMVASVDRFASYWTSAIELQKPRQEIIEAIGPMFQTLLNAFVAFPENQGRCPHTVIVYRDGVSEGEYETVAAAEYDQIKRVLQSKEITRNTKVVFIIVTKRHHTRFFPERGAGDRSGNCPPGFVVEDQIVHSAIPDYYLLSHSGIIGTSRPSHYIVLRNDAQMTQQQLQELSFNLCHSYAAATRSVSIPTPVYYADLLCGHADYHFSPDEVANLDDDSSTNTSNQDFNLEQWQTVFKRGRSQKSLYFL